MPESLRPTLDFLRDLHQNNDREWFKQNRKRYDAAREAFEFFVAEVIARFNEVEDFGHLTPPETIYRINRDVRFSRDKSPYKDNFGSLIGKQGRKSPGISYYVQIQPGNQSMIAGGIYMPSNELLAAVRTMIDEDPRALRKALNAKNFKQYFGSMSGEQLKTAPKGYSKDHPDIDLLRYKQFLADHMLTDEDVLAEDLIDKVITVSKAMKPFLHALYDSIDPAVLENTMEPR